MPDQPAAVPEDGYTDAGVPTFEAVRETIESRYATSVGSAELAAETPEGNVVEQQYEARQRAAAARLAEIRDAMHRQEPDRP